MMSLGMTRNTDILLVCYYNIILFNIEEKLLFLFLQRPEHYKHLNISLVGFSHHKTQVLQIFIRMLYTLFQMDGMHRFSTDLKPVESWGGES